MFLVFLYVQVEYKASVVMVGFSDGVIRVIRVLHDSDEPDLYGRKKTSRCTLTLIKVMKPHNFEVNCMQIDQDCRLMATGVSW